MTLPNFRIIQFEYTDAYHHLPATQPMDLVFADPPYNQGVKYVGDRTKDKCTWPSYWNWTRNVLYKLRGVMRPGATLWWVCPEEHADTIGPLLTEIVGPRLYRIVWHETFSQYNRYDLTQDYRFIFCHTLPEDAQPGASLGNPQWSTTEITKNLDDIRIPSERMKMGDKRAAGPRIPGRMWKMRRLQGTAKARVDWHPAQMPPEILQRIIKGWTSPGDTVLDAFAGSGSMGVVCMEEGRDFVGIDQSEEYCKRMVERLGQAQGS